MKKTTFAIFVAAMAFAAAGASAHDHLADGATAPGADNRGFANPVAANPSGTSGAAAQPATVPGLGNPNSGHDLGTPSFDPDALQDRLDARAVGQ